jgi:hypothetical protein
MTKSATRFETISKIVLVIISVSLGIFLISLGNKILGDVTKLYKSPSVSEFLEKDSMDYVSKQIANSELNLEKLNERKEHLSSALESANSNYQSEKESFDAWIKTRKTLGSPEQDKDVLTRTKKLDELRLIRDEWSSRLSENISSINQTKSDRSKLEKEKQSFDAQALEKYEEELRWYTLKIFLIRLLFALPILLLGVFLFMKFRKSKYNAFVWGYALFSLYVFFIGLVPYLPSYGGYVRYIVGVILTIILGYYVIKQLTAYTERKKAELSKSTQERGREIAYNTAAKAFETHTCPSCERNFLVIQSSTDKEPNFCIHCGLKLFGKCSKCGQRNFIHFPFCSACGSSITIDITV